MFRSVKIKNISVTAFSLICTVAFVTVCVIMLRTGAPATVSVKGEDISLRAEDEDDIRAFLEACGYGDAELFAERDVTVPVKSNAVYEDYLELQKAQGLDPEPYAGRAARELAFSHGEDEAVYLLICDGRMIAAHVCDMSGGNIRPLI